MPIRYMGTKRHIAHRVRDIVADLEPKGRVLDLFSGMGSVAESLAGIRPIVANDALCFTNAFARTRFIDSARKHRVADVVELIRAPYRSRVADLSEVHRTRLRAEQRALDGDHMSLRDYMADAECVANSDRLARLAMAAREMRGSDRYQLATLYFSAGYFGLRQAIEVDALRYAIDCLGSDHEVSLDWLLSAWIGAASTVINAPGHTAQYLRPNDARGFGRIRRYWRRSVWDEFQTRLVELKPVGTSAWRRRNRVANSDALTMVSRGDLRGVGAVYADPPYTKDQYSRYYHVYETLYRYDFPDSHGAGRVRSDRFSTGFCLKSGVVAAFEELFDGVAARGIPLILSYPTDGLLATTGTTVDELLDRRLQLEVVHSFTAQHSTMGASSGLTTKTATENLYVCTA